MGLHRPLGLLSNATLSWQQSGVGIDPLGRESSNCDDSTFLVYMVLNTDIIMREIKLR